MFFFYLHEKDIFPKQQSDKILQSCFVYFCIVYADYKNTTSYRILVHNFYESMEILL